jgi:cobaltochelatase CobT
MSRLGALWESLRGWAGQFSASAVPADDSPPPSGYRVYTKAHDREISLSELDSVLGPLTAADWRKFEASKAACSVGLAEWQAEANARALLWRNKLASLGTEADRKATCVTILLDLSGSMRDQRIMTMRGVLGVFGVVPEALGLQFEILGFTTVRWQGGRSRLDWLDAGKPRWPGRLNDLLHVVIVDADVRESARLADFEQLLRPDLLKENIDGEAIEWASARLLARNATRRALIVVSDGASVDDSTLQVNDNDYLHRHLEEVVAALQRRGEIELFGVGIDYSPARYYRDARTASTPDQLLDALFCTLQAALAPPPVVDLEATG